MTSVLSNLFRWSEGFDSCARKDDSGLWAMLTLYSRSMRLVVSELCCVKGSATMCVGVVGLLLLWLRFWRQDLMNEWWMKPCAEGISNVDKKSQVFCVSGMVLARWAIMLQAFYTLFWCIPLLGLCIVKKQTNPGYVHEAITYPLLIIQNTSMHWKTWGQECRILHWKWWDL